MMTNPFLKIFLIFLCSITSIYVLGQDEAPPIFDEYIMELDVECSELSEVHVTATDESGEEVEITFSDAAFSGGCTDNIVRTYTATDPSGNSATAIQILVVVDETPPTFIGAGEDMQISCDDPFPAIPEVIAYDECSEVEIEEVGFSSSEEIMDCIQIYSWTWSATDECGNYGEYTKIITVVDDEAPVFTSEPNDFYLGCEEEYPAAEMLTATDNCNDFTIDFEEEIIEGGVEEGMASYCTAQDVSFLNHTFSMKLINSPAHENYITSDLVFTQMPDGNGGILASLSGNVYAEDDPNAGFYVHMEFENSMTWEEWSSQDFPTSYHDDLDLAGETHQDWTYFTMNDANSFMSGLGDYENSELDLTHTPSNFYYGFQLGNAASGFTSNYGFSGWFAAEGIFYDASSSDEEIINGIEFDYAGDIYTELNCCPVESLIRTWTATDICGNSSQVQQIITKIDVLAPEFTFVPEDLLLECSEEIPMVMAEATDNCSDPVVTVEEEYETTECDSEYTIYRTFTATDNCGLQAQAVQIITVHDTEAPVLIDVPESMVLDCDEEVPAPPVISAMDNCDETIEVMFSEEILGQMPPENAEAFCVGSTPANFEAGWSGILFDPILGDVLVTTNEATFIQYPDLGLGITAEITAELQSVSNENAGWNLQLSLVSGMSWDDWSNQTFPTSFKDELGTAGDLYLDWTYFILEEGTLEGWGDWEGSSLTLAHAPINYYYGFQLGEQAGNVNQNYGIGGWMSYSGTLYDELGNLILVDGAGDLAFDLDCCPQFEVVRTWTAADCAGNSVSQTQTNSFDHVETEDEIVTEEEMAETEENLTNLQGKTMEDLISIQMNPNPVNTSAELEILSEINVPGRIEIYNSQGLKVRSVYEGKLDKDEPLKFSFNKGTLTAGIYVVKIYNNSGNTSTKFMIEE